MLTSTQSLMSFVLLWVSLCRTFHMNGITEYMVFGVQDISPILMF